MPLTSHRIAQLIDDISIASLRSWLKAQGFEHSANTREQMVQRLLKLIKNKELSEDEFETAISNIEEASSKRIFLMEMPDDRTPLESAEFDKRLQASGKKLSDRVVRAPRLPSKPTLVYISRSNDQIRAKWAETQVRLEADYASREIIEKKVTRLVVMLADLATGIIQLRYDKPEIGIPSHENRDDYFGYYRQSSGEILGMDCSRFEIREALRSLVETEPRIVRIRVNEHRSKTDKSVRFVARKAQSDVRDDPEWKAAFEAGGQSRAYDDQAVYWLPDASNGKLNREVFSDIDAVTSMIRVDADCHEDEIQYAVSKVREHQIRASASASQT